MAFMVKCAWAWNFGVCGLPVNVEITTNVSWWKKHPCSVWSTVTLMSRSIHTFTDVNPVWTITFEWINIFEILVQGLCSVLQRSCFIVADIEMDEEEDDKLLTAVGPQKLDLDATNDSSESECESASSTSTSSSESFPSKTSHLASRQTSEVHGAFTWFLIDWFKRYSINQKPNEGPKNLTPLIYVPIPPKAVPVANVSPCCSNRCTLGDISACIRKDKTFVTNSINRKIQGRLFRMLGWLCTTANWLLNMR